jgi:hypothetical protein
MRVSAPALSCLSDIKVNAWPSPEAFGLATTITLLTSASSASNTISLLAIITIISPRLFQSDVGAIPRALIDKRNVSSTTLE